MHIVGFIEENYTTKGHIFNLQYTNTYNKHFIQHAF
jgi:hypothetical protein